MNVISAKEALDLTLYCRNVKYDEIGDLMDEIRYECCHGRTKVSDVNLSESARIILDKAGYKLGYNWISWDR